MTEPTTNPSQTASAPAEATRKRKARRASSVLSRGFSRLLDAEVELLGGIAGATSSGIRAFGDELPARKEAGSADWTQSLLSGLSEGSATFFEDMSKVLRRASTILLEEEDEEENEEQE